MTRRTPGDQRRGDIKVVKSGTRRVGPLQILDVGIICPGSQRLVSKGTDTIPGKAAAGLPACTDDTIIHAPERAAQNTGEGGNIDYQDLGLEVADPTEITQVVPW